MKNSPTDRRVACHIRSGDVTGDGWTVYAVSYELYGPLSDEIISKVWTHEIRKRPRSTIERHRQWGPVDIIPVLHK